MPLTSWCVSDVGDLHIYGYSYLLEARFMPAIDYHFFKLRVRPCENACQHVVEQQLTLTPACRWLTALDGQGNEVQYGGYDEEHDLFRVESRGVVALGPYRIPDAHPNDIYRHPSPMTLCPPLIGSPLPLSPFHVGHSVADQSTSAPLTLALTIMHWVHSQLIYTPGVTDNATTAAEALRLGRGVCQDYAHLMIACCRQAGLYARYVNGLIPGEGATHAWVEVHDGEAWLGFDPTHDCQIQSGYIKLAHGRDVTDCPTNRGRIYGWTSETLSVACSVMPIANCQLTVAN